jgi:hypothetical protein
MGGGDTPVNRRFSTDSPVWYNTVPCQLNRMHVSVYASQPGLPDFRQVSNRKV